MRVFPIDPHSDPRWSRFVAEHPQGTIYHHPAWIRALEMEYGQRGLHIGCEDDGGSLRAILPLLYTRGLPFQKGSRLYGRRLSSLPRTPIAGPLYTDVEAARAVLKGAVGEMGEDGGVQLQIKMKDDRLNGLMEGVVGVPWRESYLLPLGDNRASEFRISNSRHRKSVQGSLTKARRSGVVARQAEDEGDLRRWYGLYLRNMRSHAVPPRPYRFFSLLWQLLRPLGLMQLILAEQDRSVKPELFSGSIYFSFGKTTTYAFNGSSREAFETCSNDLVTWCAITEAMAMGQIAFDFGEVPDGNRGLAWFKGKWGARPTRLYRYYLPAIPDKEGGLDRSGRYGSHLVEAVWRRLPLGATAFLGDQIYRLL